MTASRACNQCKASKIKCDLSRPRCGRCAKRETKCEFPSSDPKFSFFNENEVARRNSQRARGSKGARTPPRDLSAALVWRQSSPGETDTNLDWKSLYPWLNARTLANLPEPLKRDPECRAVERFFINWVLAGGGASPGHMDFLPVLYHSSPAESTLWHAVRAIAFADLKAAFWNGATSSVRARRSYGAALRGIRASIANGEELANDSTFASLLLIDSFETVYLGRTEPLGDHGQAVGLILQLRGYTQLFSRLGFGLCSIASHRLLSRQLLRQEYPHPVQQELLSHLDADRPDVRIYEDAYRIATLCAEAHTVLESGDGTTDEEIKERLEHARALRHSLQSMVKHAETLEMASSHLWRPRSSEPSSPARKQADLYPVGHPFAHFSSMNILVYPDTWIAFGWNFHAAAQVLLREALISVIRFIATHGNGGDADSGGDDRIRWEETAINALCSSIIRSLPPLLGFMDTSLSHGGPTQASTQQGQVVGQCLILFALDVLVKAEHAEQQHKAVAKEVLAWVYKNHALAV
ncbi:uncharacterized protein LTR77_001326 [Saxophila tyrrhenica]|uniref:Zn(2)-C6 fungal-type domain-containing protein n=1 Tax=Saxophila tyrrhenica TaxID=1690608 RepID=A0AAV9PMY4_9PEZI|nr:hypothetical protein LTR77_001326 [Saxophila tyrrhenica]